MSVLVVFFFFNDTATTEIYTLSLHDALPIYRSGGGDRDPRAGRSRHRGGADQDRRRQRREHPSRPRRSEEHTSELQSRQYLVCRLLLEKKKSLRITSRETLHCR